MRILLISDNHHSEVAGGAEVFDAVLLDELGADFIKSPDFKTAEDYDLIIISNHFFLSKESQEWIIQSRIPYILTCHDFILLPSRIPNNYENFTCPPNERRFLQLYQNAREVVLMSAAQKDIFLRNGVDGWNFSGNLWTDEQIDFLLSFDNEKNGRAAILNSPNWGKGTATAIEVAEYKGLEYDLIGGLPYKEFISKLAEYSYFICWAQIQESYSRICAEAKLCGVEVIANGFVPFMQEEHSKLNRQDLGEYLKKKSKELVDKILSYSKVESENNI